MITNLETLLADNNRDESLIEGPIKSSGLHLENRDEIKSSVRKKILSDHSKIIAESQKELSKLLAPTFKKAVNQLNLDGFNSETEIFSPETASTTTKSETTTLESFHKLLVTW